MGLLTTVLTSWLLAAQAVPSAIMVRSQTLFGETNVTAVGDQAVIWRWGGVRGLEWNEARLFKDQLPARWIFRPTYFYRVTDRPRPPMWTMPSGDALAIATRLHPGADPALMLHQYTEHAAGWPCLALYATDIIPEGERGWIDT